MINTGNLIFFLRARLGEDLTNTTHLRERAAVERKLALVEEFAQLHDSEERLTDAVLQARHGFLLHGTMLGLARGYRRHTDYGKWET